jgi:hypothetical protein
MIKVFVKFPSGLRLEITDKVRMLLGADDDWMDMESSEIASKLYDSLSVPIRVEEISSYTVGEW